MSNFLLYRLDWNAQKQKYDKHPAALDGYYPVNGEKNTATLEAAQAALSRLGTEHYRLAFWFTEPLKMAFLDFDNCIVNGVIDDEVQRIIAPFIAMGAFFEISQSGNGVHVVCRYSGELPPHSNKQESHSYEFYTHTRGMVFGSQQQGDWNVDCTLLLHEVLPRYFPASTIVTAGSDVRRPEWRGPEDDDELIRRMLNARLSAAAAFGGKASLRDLWEGKAPKNNDSDMSLAAHLAFWTGCDGDRMERLMRRSGLYREKWDVHSTYLRKLTIGKACAACNKVYQEPQRELVVPGNSEGEQDFLDRINRAGTYDEIMDEIVPAIAASNISSARRERLATLINKKLDLFDGKLPISRLRSMLQPKIVSDPQAMQAPEWAMRHCYVLSNDKFFDTLTGSEYTIDGFRAEYSRMMPIKQNGDREDPVKWCRERWNIVVVDDRAYRPDQPQYFDWGGKRFANRFVPSSVPATDEHYTPEGAKAIGMFFDHVTLLCGGRANVATHLLHWMAHNVQKPGKKIRWSPIIKGVEGDGKSVIGTIMRSVLGIANVKTTSNSTLSNSGGFTDWASSHAVNVIEEIYLVGRERHRIFNAMKVFISDEIIDINKKGRANGDSIWNPVNHIAFTNYSDAIPLDDRDRRWMVVFTPYNTIEDVARAKGLGSVDEVVRYIGHIADVAKAHPGQFRKWFLEMDLSSFDPNARAPWTDEKEKMSAASRDDFEDIVMQVLEEGAYGVHRDVFSSSCLNRAVKMAMMKQGDMTMPATTAWHHLLTRLRYVKASKVVKWDGQTHRLWSRPGLEPTSNEAMRLLDGSKVTSSVTSGANL